MARIERPYVCAKNSEIKLPNLETCEQRRKWGQEGKAEYLDCQGCSGPVVAPTKKIICNYCKKEILPPYELKLNGSPYRRHAECRQAMAEIIRKSKKKAKKNMEKNQAQAVPSNPVEPGVPPMNHVLPQVPSALDSIKEQAPAMAGAHAPHEEALCLVCGQPAHADYTWYISLAGNGGSMNQKGGLCANYACFSTLGIALLNTFQQLEAL